MGFLDKIKNAKNFVTGGGAKVQIQLASDANRGQNIPLTVRAQVAGAPLNVAKVYVKVRATERVEMDLKIDGSKKEIREEHETFQQEFVLTGPLQLDAQSQHEWNGEVTLPPNVAATFRGKNSKHVWEFQAALDVKGNDPDSGWQELNVN